MGKSVLTVRSLGASPEREDTVEMPSQGPAGGPHAGPGELMNSERGCGAALGPRGRVRSRLRRVNSQPEHNVLSVPAGNPEEEN